MLAAPSVRQAAGATAKQPLTGPTQTGDVAFHGTPGGNGTFNVSGLATASGTWTVVRIGP